MTTFSTSDVSTGTAQAIDDVLDYYPDTSSITASFCEEVGYVESDPDISAALQSNISAATKLWDDLRIADPGDHVEGAVKGIVYDLSEQGLTALKGLHLTVTSQIAATTTATVSMRQAFVEFADGVPVRTYVEKLTGKIVISEVVQSTTTHIPFGEYAATFGRAIGNVAIMDSMRETAIACYNATFGQETNTFTPVEKYLVMSATALGAVAGAVLAPEIALAAALYAGVFGALSGVAMESLITNVPTAIQNAKSLGKTLGETLAIVEDMVRGQVEDIWEAVGTQADDFLERSQEIYSDFVDGVSDLSDINTWYDAPVIGDAMIAAQTIFQQAEAMIDFSGGTGWNDPVILDLDGDGIELTDRLDSSIYFNIAGTEFANIVAWSTGGDGMLVNDDNTNGEIDDVTELIGGNTEGGGFIALRETYDTNQDGVIDSYDSSYTTLRVWIDTDVDGRTDTGELHSLSSLDITSIDLNAIDVSYQIAGNNITQESTFTMDGQTRTMVDAWFAFDTVNTIYTGSYDLDARVLFLPEQRGYGDLPNLSIAMSLDEALLDMVAEIAAEDLEGLVDPAFDLQDKMRAILLKWADVDGVSYVDYGVGLDTQTLAFMEKVVGQTYDGIGISGISFLASGWNLIFGAFSANILAQAGMHEMLGSPTYDVATDTLDGDINEGTTILRFTASEGTSIYDSGFNDVYVFGADDGEKSIMEHTSVTDDTVVLAGVDPENVQLYSWNYGGEYHLAIQYGENDITHVYLGEAALNGAIISDEVERIAFDDGTIWDLTGGLHLTSLDGGGGLEGTNFDDTIDGGSGTDYLSGFDGNDTLSGGGGSGDQLFGNEGDDSYVVDASENPVSVMEYDGEGTDTIFIHGVSSASASLQTYSYTGGMYRLVVTYGGNEKILIEVGAADLNGGVASNRVENIVFDDTTVWTLTDGLHLKNDDGGGGMEGTNFDDTIEGGSSIDYLSGFDGNDTLSGGGGSGDQMYGGLGNDTYIVVSGTDYLLENASEGTDTVQSSIAYTLDSNVENLTLTGSSNINATGNGLNNVIAGNSGNNTLNGDTGTDTLSYANATGAVYADMIGGTATGFGSDTFSAFENFLGSDHNDTIIGTAGSNIIHAGAGNDIIGTGSAATADTMHGGAGDDYYYANNAGDTHIENVSEGNDTVQAGLSWTLASNIENLILGGASAINGTGNSLNNTLTGNNGTNTLTGGAGDDTYIVGTGDVVVEGSSAGTDTVQTALAYTLGSNVENLTLTGSSNVNGTGNTLDNVLTGNSGNNTLAGGTGNDTYVIGQGGTDVLTEAASAGTDIVQSSVAWTLGTNFENLTLTGSSNVSGTGNGADNVIMGNSGNNTLAGGLGTDTLSYANATAAVSGYLSGTSVTGGGGTDIISAFENFIGSDYDDVLGGNTSANIIIGGLGNDTIDAGNGNDTIYGNDGHDILGSGAGDDAMYGGTGDDTYYMNGAGDTITENAAEGTDTVLASITYTLGSNVENLTVGTGTINGTGNSLANVIIGGSGVNTLTGAAGDDLINSKAGADILYGGLDSDTFAFDLDGIASIDTIKDFSTAQNDKLDIADLLTGYDPLTSLITNFLEITTSGANSVVKVDRDGTGGTYSLVQIATIEGVTGLTDEDALLTAGMVIAA